MAEFSKETQEKMGFGNPLPSPFVSSVSENTLAAEKRKAEKAEEQLDFTTLYTTAANEEQVAPIIGRNLYRFSATPYNPVTEITPEMSDALTEGLVDENAIEDIFDAARTTSLDYAMTMAEDYRQTAKNRELLAQAGWRGVGATVLAAMTDPAELTAIGATTALVTSMSGPAAPVTAPATAIGGTVLQTGRGLAKGYDVYRGFKIGAGVGAAEAAAFESIRANLKYDITGGDVMLAGLFGAGLTGGINAATVAFAKRAKVQHLAQRSALGEALTPEEQAFLRANDGDELTNRIIAQEAATGEFAGLGTKSIAEISAEEARSVSMQRGIKLFGLRSLVSPFVKAKASSNGFIRLGADKLGLNSTGNKSGDVVTPSASEVKAYLESKYRTAFARTLTVNRKAWIAGSGGTVQDFNTLVARAIRDPSMDVPREVRQVADDVQRQQKELANLAIKHNVAGFTTGILDNHPNYLPRLFSNSSIDRLRTKYGADSEVFADLVEAALRSAQPDIEASVRRSLQDKGLKRITDKMVKTYIRKMAAGYAKNVFDRPYKIGAPRGGLDLTVDELTAALKREELDDDVIIGVIEAVTKTRGVRAHKRAQPRLLLDENITINAKTLAGDIEELSFSDLLETDIENLHNAYVFQMAGGIGLARNGINTNAVGSSFEDFLKKIEQENVAQGLTGNDGEIKALQYMYDGITGQHVFKQDISDVGRRIHRRVREYGFITNMGMSGMAALMEITNSLMEYSLPVLFRTMPQYRRLYAKAANGQLDDALLRELEVMTGLGGDVVTSRFNRASRFEGGDMDSAMMPDQPTKTDEALGRMREHVSILSGLSGVTASLRRISMLNYSSQWVRAAAQGKQPFSKIKMEQLGIDADMQSAIFENIKKHATTRSNGKVLQSLNIDRWDEDVREVFSLSVYREATQNVQEMNLGSVNGAFRSEWGKTVTQFLSFPLAALEQQTMRLGVRARHGDISVGKVIMGSMFMGSLMYMAKVQMAAVGRSDADEYIKERMSMGNFTKGSMEMIGVASIFGYIAQVTTGMMNGNSYSLTPPALGMASNAVQAAANALGEDDMTEGEWRKSLRLAPFSSLYLVKQALNKVANEAAN